MTEPKTHTLDVPGAVLHYDVRSDDSSAQPVLLLIGSPMGARGFATLAGHFTDRTVVTYDPRGAERSRRTDAAAESTPDEHADDLHRLISALDAGPVDVFASSGGAVNGLVLVARHSEQVRTLVAHEPPASQELPDREPVLAACDDIHQTYQRSGLGPAMAKFIALVSHEGPIPAGFADRPAPSPADFGLPAEDDGSRDNPLVGQNIISCNYYRHDFDALRAASSRVVMAVGAESTKMIAGRAALVVAERLGTRPVTFAGGHDGFLGGEYGSTGEPDAFAATLREILTD
ncbi:alpha/beta hydrolase [Actinoallomurus bryophytorum]|uniref:Pimeloyl-ACP methyl ester carboxylesterase n=1 Tax=Actinoallomurus bryophytorum TaxID=1490222 RepID=A0A543CH79_9ACTN|nr:alpha/beta hydrolase [Actinoallomurus bryophytorum]TQL96462.1 pimeloyl-ACP methyl ester carboxylesterase [Actinoallomurus bryophytorum]